jgi:hypothetical protein
VSRDDLVRLLFLAESHHDDFVRAACAARALDLRGASITAGAVRQLSGAPQNLAADIAGWYTGRRPLNYTNRQGRQVTATWPGAARNHVMAAVEEGLLGGAVEA